MNILKYIIRSLLLPICTLLITTSSLAQTSTAFVPLFTADGLDNWTLQDTDANFFDFNNGILSVQGNKGWLRSPREYGDFILQLEFRFTTTNADSGVFLRAGTDTPFIFGWPGDAYQVQIRDISENQSDNPLPLANLYRHRVAEGETTYDRDRVFELYTGVNQWQSIEISMLADQLTVTLNGELVNTSENIINAQGYIGFQSEAGNIEYRNMLIREP